VCIVLFGMSMLESIKSSANINTEFYLRNWF